jgi:hypothetical protein
MALAYYASFLGAAQSMEFRYFLPAYLALGSVLLAEGIAGLGHIARRCLPLPRDQAVQRLRLTALRRPWRR